MSRLSLFLPSFAADYSGACSCLFDLDFLVVVNDAACCTRNYVDYDEPRWSRTKTTTMCSELRMMDVVMGDEAKAREKVLRAADEMKPRAIALLGSPVPALTGMDLHGIAHDVEESCGLPTLGFETTGFSTYERGIALALRGLMDRFCLKAAPGVGARTAPAGERRGSGGQSSCPAHRTEAHEGILVNVLGMTPLDFGANGNDEDLGALLSDSGCTVVSSWCMGYTLEDVFDAPRAQVSLVVSDGALLAAEAMSRVLGTPYVVGVPCAGRQAELVCAELRRAALGGGRSHTFAKPSESLGSAGCLAGDEDEAALVVGDWVCAASLRSAMRLSGWRGRIVVASFFGGKPAFAEPGDEALADERALRDLVARGRFACVVGDPLLDRVPGVAACRRVRLAHPAVSSNLFADDVPHFFRQGFGRILEQLGGGDGRRPLDSRSDIR